MIFSFLIISARKRSYTKDFVKILHAHFRIGMDLEYLLDANNFIDNKYIKKKKIQTSVSADFDFYIQHLIENPKYAGIRLNQNDFENLKQDTHNSCLSVYIYDTKDSQDLINSYNSRGIRCISYHDLLLSGFFEISDLLKKSDIGNVFIEKENVDKVINSKISFKPIKHIRVLPNSSQKLVFHHSSFYTYDLILTDLLYCYFFKIADKNTVIEIIDIENKGLLFTNFIRQYFGEINIQFVINNSTEFDIYFSEFQGFTKLYARLETESSVKISWFASFKIEESESLLPLEFMLTMHDINPLNSSDELQEVAADEVLKYRYLFELQKNKQLRKRLKKYENSLFNKIKKKVRFLFKVIFRDNASIKSNLKNIFGLLRFVMSTDGKAIFRKRLASLSRYIFFKIEFRPFEFKYLGDKDNMVFVNYHSMRVFMNMRTAEKKPVSEQLSKIKFSIVMPLYNPPIKFFKEALVSIEQQLYPNWELCMADDCSSPDKRKIIKRLVTADKNHKIHYRDVNGHISLCTNDALKLASGDFVVFMDQDDLLTQDCLAELAECIQKHPNCDIIYSDEDKIDKKETFTEPHFKTDWAPDSLLSRNYFGHVVAMRRSLVEELGGCRIGFEGSQDYDLILRATEKANQIIHIPKVLYHWRIHTLSAAASEEAKPYAYKAAKKALEDALLRRNKKGKVNYLFGFRGYDIDFELTDNEKVSIIIPTKDQLAFVKNAVESIFTKTNYSNFEIVLIDNNSSDKDFFEYMEACKSKYAERFIYLKAAIPFNFSRLMNIGVENSTGKYVCLLNNDTEVINPDWLTHMVSYSQQSHVGAVGAKLLYPDNTIQHAGVIVGLGGVAGHAFVGLDKDEPGYFNYVQTVNNFSALTAACLLIQKSVYNEVGGFDEGFEIEFNDVDFCLKLIEKGYFNVYLPKVELYHYESVSRGHPLQNQKSYQRHLVEMQKFKAKWNNYILKDPYFNPNLNIGSHDYSINMFLES